MRLLDLFCGAGGAAMGYHQAGFEVIGVDIKKQINYPFECYQADAMTFDFTGFDVIHASPPCQAYSRCKSRPTCRDREYPDLIQSVRQKLIDSRLPYIIENVKGSPLISPFKLTGLMLNLRMHRERWFESNLFILTPERPLYKGEVVGKKGMVSMVGGGDSGRGRIPADHRTKLSWQKASGITWMTSYEMTQAIPPAYTKWIGEQIISQLIREKTENKPATEKVTEPKLPEITHRSPRV